MLVHKAGTAPEELLLLSRFRRLLCLLLVQRRQLRPELLANSVVEAVVVPGLVPQLFSPRQLLHGQNRMA